MNKEDAFHALLEKKGLKLTHERKLIFDEVSKLNDHFNADGLYDRFKNKGVRVSRDTVYRTLPLLLESNVVQKSVGEGKREFFERTDAKGHHDHMVCVECGRVVEFHCEEIEELQENIAKKHGFDLRFHDHRLFGICKGCRAS